MKRIAYVSALLVSTVLAGGNTAFGQNVNEAVQIAIETNPSIGIVTQNREMINEELRQARGLYLPQVDMVAGIGPEWTNDSTTRASGRGTEDLTRTETRMTLQQRLFDGFEADSEVEKQQARIESAAHRIYDNSEVLALDVIGAYLEVIRQRQLYALSKENVDKHAEILSKLETRMQGGIGNMADVNQAKARYSRAQATLTGVNNDLAEAETAYTRLVGQYPGELTLPGLPVEALPKSLNEAVDLSTYESPAVKVRKADVKVAKADVDKSEAAFYPKVNIEAESAYYDSAGGVDTYEKDANVMLRMRWNLFRGGIDRAARQEALATMHQARNERMHEVRLANEEARRSWFSYEASKKKQKELEESVIYSRETRDAYTQQFDVGQRTLLDVLDSENELFTSRGQLVSANINETRAGYRLLASTGQLLKTLKMPVAVQADPVSESFMSSMFDD